MKISTTRSFQSVAALLGGPSPRDLTHDVFTNAPAEFHHASLPSSHTPEPRYERHRLAVAASHDSNEVVHPSPRSFCIAFSQARFDGGSSQVASRVRSGKAEVNSDGVVTLSNARLVTFAVHDSTDWTQESGLLMMPRYRTPAGSAEPTFPINAQIVSVCKSMQRPASFSTTSRTKHERWETEAAPGTPPPPPPLRTSGTMTCIGVSAYLVALHTRLASSSQPTHVRRCESPSRWHDRVHFLQCEAQRESKLRLRLDQRQCRYGTNAQQRLAHSLGATPRSHCAANKVPDLD